MWIFSWGSVVVAITAWDVFYLESYLTPDPGSDGVERKYEISTKCPLFRSSILMKERDYVKVK